MTESPRCSKHPDGPPIWPGTQCGSCLAERMGIKPPNKGRELRRKVAREAMRGANLPADLARELRAERAAEQRLFREGRI